MAPFSKILSDTLATFRGFNDTVALCDNWATPVLEAVEAENSESYWWCRDRCPAIIALIFQ